MGEIDTNEKTISLADLWAIFIHRFWLLMAIIIFCAVGGAVIGRFLLPIHYTATTLVCIDMSDSTLAENTQLSMATSLPKGIEKSITSDTVVAKVNDKFQADGKDYKYDKKKISVSTSSSSTGDIFFNVSYTLDSRENSKTKQAETKDILFTAIEVLRQHTTEKDINYYVQDIDGVKASRIKVYDDINMVKVTIKKDTIKSALIAGVIGIVIAGILVVLEYFLDDTFKDKETVEAITGTDVIAFIAYADDSIPSVKTKGGKK